MSVVKPRIGPADHGRAMTLGELREAEEEPGYLYELARGVLEVGEVPSDEHAKIIDTLPLAIDAYRLRHRGRIYLIAHGGDVRLVIPELESGRHPDLAIVFRGAPLGPRGRQIPEWACEVASPGVEARRRDYEQKSEEDLTRRIGEYWIVDPGEKRVTARFREETPEGPIWSERVFTGDETIVSALLPGLRVTVAELWADLEPAPGDDGDGD